MRVGASVDWVFGWGAMRVGAGTGKRGRKEQVSLGREKGRSSGSRVTDLRSSGVISLSTLDDLGGVGVLEGMSQGRRVYAVVVVRVWALAQPDLIHQAFLKTSHRFHQLSHTLRDHTSQQRPDGRSL